VGAKGGKEYFCLSLREEGSARTIPKESGLEGRSKKKNAIKTIRRMKKKDKEAWEVTSGKKGRVV